MTNSTMSKPSTDPAKTAPWLYWASTTLVFIAFMGSGFANLLHGDHVMADMARLGYPVYFSTILGAWKVAGALSVVVPRSPQLKEWAYAGMIFDLSGAALSRAAIQDPVPTILAPLVVLVVVLISWRTRPMARVSHALSRTQAGLAHRVAGG